MKNRVTSIVIICLVVITGFLGFITLESDVVSSGTTWYVGSGLGNDSTTINGGIGMASDGDTVYVYSGTYNENVVVDKAINLTGENRDSTIIDWAGSGDVVSVISDWVNITGFFITSPALRDKGLTIYSDNNNISGNKMSGNYMCIKLWHSRRNIISKNVMMNAGILIRGDLLEHWNTHTIDTSNTVDGKPLYYWKNQTGGMVPAGAGEVILANCSNVKVQAQVLLNGYVGLELGFSSNNNIITNNVLNNRFGIFLEYSTKNNIMDNSIMGNSILSNIDGLVLEHSDGNYITGNNVSNNDWDGIRLGNSDGNTITYNIIASNVQDGIDLEYSDFNNITFNTLYSNANDNIFLLTSNSNYIFDNNVSTSSDGIDIEDSSDNMVEGNTFTYNSHNGIRLWDSNLNIIINNTCLKNANGILLWNSSGNMIISNNASKNTGPYGEGAGIRQASYSRDNIIVDNILSSNNYGILIYGWDLGNNNISGNYISSNIEYGIYLWSCPNNNVIGNTVTNNGNGIYLTDFSSTNNIGDNSVSSNNEYGIGLYNSPDNIIESNNISNNRDGIYIDYFYGGNDIKDNDISSNSRNGIFIYWYCYGNNLKGNVITNNLNGINISSSSNNNNITANNISSNGYGIAMDDSYRNIAIGNVFCLNTWYAVDIRNDGDNTIHHNNFIDNNGGGVQARDTVGTNHWNDSYPSGGNYWDDWTTPDTMSSENQDIPGSDGFVDFPYFLDGGMGARDYFPFSIPLEISPPIITNLQPSDASTINDSKPIIGADYYDPSGIDVSSVLLKVDGINVTLSAIVTANNVSYLPGAPLSEGIHTAYIEVKDIFGNLATGTWSFTVDTLPPVITNLQPPDASITNDSTPIISADYSDPAGINVSTVMLKVDGVDVTPSATVTAGNATYIPGTAVSDGIHTVYVEVKDNVNNLATATWSFTVDTTPPAIILNAPLNNSIIPSGTILDFDITDPNLAQANYSINGGADFPFSGSFDISTGGWTDGYYTIQINASDIVGNSNSSWYFFTIDSNPPTMILNAPMNNSVIPAGTILDFTIIDLSSFQANYSINGGTDIPFSSPFDISTAGWTDGDYVAQINAVDLLGHSNSSWYFFTIDSTPPVITNLQPPDSSTTNDNTTTISADYSDPSGINVSSVVLEVDGIDVTLSATVTVNTVSYIPGTALSDGIHTVYLEVRDNVGNLATETWSFTVDTTPPTITNIQPPDTTLTNDSTPTMSADYSDSSGINVSTVMLKVDGVDVTPSATVTAGNATYIPGTALSDGIHTVYVEVKDNVGNLATVTWTFTVDTTPPTIILNSPLNNSVIPSGTFLDFDITDPNLAQVNYSINGGADFPFFEPYDLSTAGWTDGYYTVQINAIDFVGNSNSSWYFFTIDSQPPVIILNAPVNNSVIPDGALLNFTIFDLTSFQANYSINGGGDIPFSDPFDISTAGWADGDYVVQINAVDLLGRLNSSWYFFTIDSTPPVVTNLQPPDASTTNDSFPKIGADYSDPSGIDVSSVLLEVDGMDVTLSATVTPTKVSYIAGMALSDGSHTVYLEVRDNIGNLATATWSFTVDTLPPTTAISPENFTVMLGTTFTLTATDGVGGCGVNYTQYKIDDGDWIEYSAPFSIAAYGYHNISYRSVDNLGNIEDENTLSIYVPIAPITTLIVGSPQYGTTPLYVNCSTQFSLSVIDYSGTGCDTFYYIDTSPPVLYVGSFTVLTEGAHTIYYYSADNLGNIEDTREFDIIVDNTPPATDIDIGDPHYVSEDILVTSATEFTFITTDGGLIPVGINLTIYRIWNEGVWTSWNTYAGTFSLGTNEGLCYLEFYSIDWLGNEEAVQNRSYIVDDTPPTTSISVGDPKYKGVSDDIWNITSATTFTLSAIDEGVGINYTEYRIWDNGSWSEWYRYVDGFVLGLENGTRYVEWFGVDYLGNKGLTHNETHFVDNIPPVTNYLLLLEPDSTEARLSLIPRDVGSGVDFTKYRIDSGDWIDYSDTLIINESGEHVIYFYSVDKLGNYEEMKEVTVLVENPETPAPSEEGKKETNFKPLIALIFAIILLLIGSYVSYERPLNFKGEVRKDRFLTWLVVVLPFAIAEITTGVLSVITGMLSVPPLFGVGIIVDTAILVGGLSADGYIYKKWQKVSTDKEQLMDRKV